MTAEPPISIIPRPSFARRQALYYAAQKKVLRLVEGYKGWAKKSENLAWQRGRRAFQGDFFGAVACGSLLTSGESLTSAMAPALRVLGGLGPMSELYYCTVPVRAEQYQVGQTEILGRPILVAHDQTTFAPHTVRCVLKPGDWVVENGDRLVNFSGNLAKQGKTVVVLSDAEFRRRYQPIT